MAEIHNWRSSLKGKKKQKNTSVANGQFVHKKGPAKAPGIKWAGDGKLK